MSDKLSIQAHTKVKKTEKSFELTLSTLVSGVDVFRKEFQEQTTLAYINSQEATFWLNTKVTLWSKLDLSVEIPQTLTLEKCLKLIISGTVIEIKASTDDDKKQLISIRLDKKYKIQPFSSKNNYEMI